MKKIPTLFKREFTKNGRVKGIVNEVTPGMEWVLSDDKKTNGYATVKMDGACCAIIEGEFYKRYDAKNGREPPDGAIQCSRPDPVTGHWPHWVKIKREEKGNKWFIQAWINSQAKKGCHRLKFDDGTYEAIGAHFNGNPYNKREDILVRHGTRKVSVERTFEGIREWLETHEEEGLVFWKDGEPRCKIKRKDFGFPWPIKRK